MSAHPFPGGFLWGAATSAQQIEGGCDEEGRGESIWDRFAATPGRIADGTTPATACDHYHRWREDVELLRRLGVNAYRFSIAWPRVVPQGNGAVNAIGLDFYDRLVELLLQSGIRPFVTLYHWDLPQALQERGGWAARETAERFVEYTEAVTERLGDRVKHWATHNEPWCTATLGHEEGVHAPGRRDPAEALRVAHHLLLSHGWAVDAVRRGAPGAEVGIVLNLIPVQPASPEARDVEAARRLDGSFNRWYLDPIFRGEYPNDVIADRATLGHPERGRLPFVLEGDLRSISRPMDFLGINYYSRAVVRAGDGGEAVAVRTVSPGELTDMGWEVFPDGLHEILVRVHRDYDPPKIYVTENGVAYADGPDHAGRIADGRRIDYLHGHLSAARRAVAAGVPLAGYFAWSLLDNFEWQHGYTKRFGLYWVDYRTQQRLPKDSAHWYRAVAGSNALPDPREDEVRRQS